jgi:transketolase
MTRGSELDKVCGLVRRDILTISYNAQMGHVGSAFSVVEILVALYFGVMKINPKDPLGEDRDRFILSKGHAASALYSVLSKKGFFSEKVLHSFLKDGSKLLVHPEWNNLAGVEHGTGSLGHGLSVGVGMAYAAKLASKNYRVYVLLSDSEMQEGEIWEAAMFASHHKLDNLVVVADCNGTQGLGKVDEILKIEPLEDKWKSFGFRASSLDGHNIVTLINELKKPFNARPKIVLAKTVIGKGVSFMEGDFRWHYYNPKKDQLERAFEELK